MFLWKEESKRFSMDTFDRKLPLRNRKAQKTRVVGSNLFGDILSDLGPATTGTIGIAPSANINPELQYPSMFEPVHGSAPDIAGWGIANPIGQIWSGAMMLDHFGHAEAGKAIVTAIEQLLADPDQRTE
jgi:tartrate dehydrogenase/decarboxylase/D-malate dehydrogenase